MILDAFRLDGRVALVTGSSRGLGRGAAVALAEAGADVALLDRGNASVTADLVKGTGRRVLRLQRDLLDATPAELSRAVADVIDDLGRLDILVNNAGTIRRAPAAGFTQPGMYLGTPTYSAPEQLTGEVLDARADIYSAGVMLSEMFCGGVPYGGQTTMEIYRQQLQEEPVRPSALWPDIPSALEEIILRCIARERAARYQSVAELGADLAQLRA